MWLLSRPRVLGGAVVLAGLSGFASATPRLLAADPPPQLQPGIEENYDYPYADNIFAEKGLRLLKGDGHILLADCGSADVVRVLSFSSRGELCFQVKGAQGYLTLELPKTYLIKDDRGDNHSLSAKVTVDGKTESVAVKKNEWTPVGQGRSPTSGPATLLEIRASP